MEWDEEKGDGLEVIDVADVNIAMQADQQKNSAQPKNEAKTVGTVQSQPITKLAQE